MAWVGPYNLIVPNGVLQNSSDVFAILDPDAGGASTFSVRLSANGLEPVTYWGCRTMLQPETHNALVSMTTQQFMTYVNTLAGVRGRQTVSGVAFKNSLLMGDGPDFWAFATSHGLQPIL